jgi:hypothetical protein
MCFGSRLGGWLMRLDLLSHWQMAWGWKTWEQRL